MLAVRLVYLQYIGGDTSALATHLALGFPNGGGSVSAPHFIMSNNGSDDMDPFKWQLS